jgi:HTH-type transcriptional regulator/antitoxin HigA
MQSLKYTVIHSQKQYNSYCKALEALVFLSSKNKAAKDEIELLTLLIKNWDDEHSFFKQLDPIELLKSLMKDHHLKSTQLSKLLGVSEGLVSDMLSYKKGLSKETIRILADHFKLKQEAFNKPYTLIGFSRSSANHTTSPHHARITRR